MTVADLIEILSNCDPTHRVVVASGKYGFKEARAVEGLTSPSE
jgi:hypothetical protein